MTKKSNVNSRKGFTIIEVALVLAIAGLIFMMVFIALPALQRSQRDTQRSNDMSRVSTALNNFAANNRGKIPVQGKALYIAGHTQPVTGVNADNMGSWGYFYDSYLLVGSAGQTDSFTDPDGEPYSLWVQECAPSQKKNGTECASTQQRYNVTFDSQSEAGLSNEPTTVWPTTGEKVRGHSIAILTHATCRDEVAVYSSGSRKVAILYKKEGGGAVCVNN